MYPLYIHKRIIVCEPHFIHSPSGNCRLSWRQREHARYCDPNLVSQHLSYTSFESVKRLVENSDACPKCQRGLIEVYVLRPHYASPNRHLQTSLKGPTLLKNISGHPDPINVAWWKNPRIFEFLRGRSFLVMHEFTSDCCIRTRTWPSGIRSSWLESLKINKGIDILYDSSAFNSVLLL